MEGLPDDQGRAQQVAATPVMRIEAVPALVAKARRSIEHRRQELMRGTIPRVFRAPRSFKRLGLQTSIVRVHTRYGGLAGLYF